MKIIFITYDLPYPLSSGGKIRAYQMLKALSTQYEITLFTYIREAPKSEYLAELGKYCRKINLYQRQKVWSLGHFLRSGLSVLPGTIAHYVNPQLRRDLLFELKTGTYAAAHFESYYTSLYLADANKLGVPTVLGSENIEYCIYQKFVDSLPRSAWPLKAFLYFDLWKMRRFEKQSWGLAKEVLAVSEGEAAVISEIGRKKVAVIPNGADTGQLAGVGRKTTGPPTLLFIGDLKYLQNDLGIKKFLAEVLPAIKKVFPDLIIKIVSSHQPKWFGAYRSEIDLQVDNRTPFFQYASQADVMINPIEVKGGTRIKLLEGLAAGLPVVTYSSSLTGFERLEPGRDLLVAETPKDFAAAVSSLLGDGQLRDRIGTNGRKVVADYYSWGKSMSVLLEVYRKLLSNEKSTA